MENDYAIDIYEAGEKDYDYILDLNEKNVEVLSPMDREKLSYFAKTADKLYGVCVDGEPAAFLIGLREGVLSYESENYKWFCSRYEKFLYVDRIVIGEKFRHMGLGTTLYEKIFDEAKAEGVPFVTAEVDIVPYNGPSLKFHEKMGFRQVGIQTVRNGSVKVSLMEKKIRI